MPSKANYVVIEDEDSYLVIDDIGPWSNFQTVTNAAEEVIKELLPRLNGRRLYYYDSDDEISELMIEAGGFAGFAFGGPADV